MTADRNTTKGTSTEADEVLDLLGVAALLRCSPSHVRALVARDRFPAPAKLGALVRWSRSVVLEWLRENTGRTVDRAGRRVEVRG